MHFNIFTDHWHWSFSGVLIGATMLLLTFFGKHFGLSSTYRTLCAIGGAGKRIPFFDFNWKDDRWNLCFVAGIVIGGFLTAQFIPESRSLHVEADTQAFLFRLGLLDRVDSAQLLPLMPSALFEVPSFLVALLLFAGGFLSGFGARYAGGCTSGHFISGLSNLQPASMLTVVFFLLGGISSTNLLLPLLAGILNASQP